MINMYPVTSQNALIWIIFLSFFGVLAWNFILALFSKEDDFVPDGYVYDKGLKAMIRKK